MRSDKSAILWVASIVLGACASAGTEEPRSAKPEEGVIEGVANVEVVAACLHSNLAKEFAQTSSVSENITWNADHTAADIVARSGSDLLVTYHAAQVGDLVRVSNRVGPSASPAMQQRHRSGIIGYWCIKIGEAQGSP